MHQHCGDDEWNCDVIDYLSDQGKQAEILSFISRGISMSYCVVFYHYQRLERTPLRMVMLVYYVMGMYHMCIMSCISSSFVLYGLVDDVLVIVAGAEGELIRMYP